MKGSFKYMILKKLKNKIFCNQSILKVFMFMMCKEVRDFPVLNLVLCSSIKNVYVSQWIQSND